MAKKCVSSKTYLILNWIFYFFCSSGFLWQFATITVTYFNFTVVTQMTIIMPEEYDKMPRHINTCFDPSELHVNKVYARILSKYEKLQPKFYDSLPGFITFRKKTARTVLLMNNATIGELFDMMVPSKSLFIQPMSFKYEATQYLYRGHFRYQINPLKLKYSYIIPQPAVSEVSLMHVSISKMCPDVEYDRLQEVYGTIDAGYHTTIFFETFSYFIQKLPWPFDDNCLNFADMKLIDLEKAVRICTNERFISILGKTFSDMLVMRNSTELFKYRTFPLKPAKMVNTQRDIWNSCLENYQPYSDCFKESIFTHVTRTIVPPFAPMYNNTLTLRVDKSNTGSIRIESKSKIDFIEYFTFTLGALGSWLGFSFIGCNPVSLLFFKNEFHADTSETKSILDIRQSLLIQLKINDQQRRRMVKLEYTVSQLMNAINHIGQQVH